MIIKKYIELEEFEAWSGAEEVLERVIESGNIGKLESYLENLYSAGCTEEELNDFLRFNDDFIYKLCGVVIE